MVRQGKVDLFLRVKIYPYYANIIEKISKISLIFWKMKNRFLHCRAMKEIVNIFHNILIYIKERETHTHRFAIPIRTCNYIIVTFI